MGKQRKKKVRGSCPNQTEIDRGLYLDFEGFAPHDSQRFRPPALCGYRVGGEGPVTQVVFSTKLKWAARESNLDCVPWKTFLSELFKTKKRHKLFAFSEHENKVIEGAFGWRFKRSYGNVRKISKQNLKGELPENCGNSLIEFLEVAGVLTPRDYGKLQVTSWLSNVMKYSATKNSWAKAPLQAQKDWRKVLKHNAFDVTSMFDLLKEIGRRSGQKKISS